jgi:hypothetical protein
MPGTASSFLPFTTATSHPVCSRNAKPNRLSKIILRVFITLIQINIYLFYHFQSFLSSIFHGGKNGDKVTPAINRAFGKPIPGIVWPPMNAMVTIYS